MISAVAFAVGFRPDLAAWFIPLGTALALSAVAAREHARGEVAAEAAVAASAGAINDWDKTALAGADHTVLAAPGAPVLRARGTCCAAVRACCGAPAGTPVWRRGADALHAVVWVAASAALLMCVGGSMTFAVGWRWFAPRGAFYAVAAGGDTVSMHAWCVCPPPSVNATIFDYGGAGHSSSDVYGFADARAAAGRRVCTADPPGTGWTRLGAADVTALEMGSFWSLPLLAAMGEPGPFVLVGSSDGGPARIYQAALADPAAVAALVPMQYGVSEFVGVVAYRGWSPAAAQDYARAALTGRLSLCDAIRTLGTTWGLVELIAGASPPPGYTPAQRWAEKNFLNLLHEGQWDLQCRILAAQVRDPASVLLPDVWASSRSLAPAIRVLAIDNPAADPCAGSQSADDCALQRFVVQLNSQFMRNMTTMAPGSRYVAYAGASTGWLGDGASDLAFHTQTIVNWL